MPGPRVLVLVALISALLAGGAGLLAVRGRAAQAAAGWQPVAVIIAARDLEVGATLGPGALAEGALPAQRVTRSVVTAEAARRHPLAGRRLAHALAAGDVLTGAVLLPEGGPPRLAEAVPPGARALTIRVTAEASVAHRLEVRDRVDVLATLREPRSGEPVALTLLQDLLVLATGGPGATGEAPGDGYATVTLQVRPQEAELLVLAGEEGPLQLALRAPGDHAPTPTGVARWPALSDGQARGAAGAGRVEIIRGRRADSQVLP